MLCSRSSLSFRLSYALIFSDPVPAARLARLQCRDQCAVIGCRLRDGASALVSG